MFVIPNQSLQKQEKLPSEVQMQRCKQRNYAMGHVRTGTGHGVKTSHSEPNS